MRPALFIYPGALPNPFTAIGPVVDEDAAPQPSCMPTSAAADPINSVLDAELVTAGGSPAPASRTGSSILPTEASPTHANDVAEVERLIAETNRDTRRSLVDIGADWVWEDERPLFLRSA